MTPRIDAVSLVTSDLGRTLTFYRALGAVPAERLEGVGEDGGHLDIEVGELKLMVDTEAVMSSFDPRWDRLAGRVSLAARCSHPDAVDELHETLCQLGGGSHLDPFDAPWGQRYASVLDPDGIRIDLYAALTQRADP